MTRLFGTDGVRGIANTELTAELAYKLGRAGAFVLSKQASHRPRIVVGKDTRVSGDMLEGALIAGICSAGAKAVRLGIIPTPAVAYLAGLYTADAGVVISASHNTYEFNGIKFFNGKGYKLPDAMEDEIESLVTDEKGKIPTPAGDGIGYAKTEENAAADYIDYILSSIEGDLKGMKIAIDCSNGAVCKTAPRVLSRLGAEVYVTGNEPDGYNINDGCGSMHINNISKFTVLKKADIGIAFDGDADRLLAVDENGRLIDGDKILSILALDMKGKGSLIDNSIVATIMSNMGLYKMAEENGLNVVKTKVGDRYVLEEMLNRGYVLGGEQSGHIIMLQHSTTGDGLLTAVHLLNAIKESGSKTSELACVMEVYPQVLKNARVKSENKNKYLEDETIMKMCKCLEEDFLGEGRVLIRASGTEPLIRVMIEGKDKQIINDRAEELVKLIEGRLG